MQQYIELLQAIKNKGSWKEPARSNMPRTLSLFGYQMRFNLQDGFPLITTKKVNFKHIVTELLWFLRGDTNIKYLVDNGCNIWNEDAYNYYLKVWKKPKVFTEPVSFEAFINHIKCGGDLVTILPDYKYGDCGKQYGWLWRKWEGQGENPGGEFGENGNIDFPQIDQIKDLIAGLKSNPMGRRHVLTAWNPATLDDMALNACHAFVQFNCRQRQFSVEEAKLINDETPMYYLDCQMYQRSADVFLGVPYNIASYALLTEILAKICNMIPGDFIHTFGDVHIYQDHIDAVDLQLTREPRNLPNIEFSDNFRSHLSQWEIGDVWTTAEMISSLELDWFTLENYNPYPSIKGKLSTGLQ